MLVKIFHEKLIPGFGADHRSSVIRISGRDCEFFSFEQLVEPEHVPDGAGYLTNHRVVLGQEILQFKNGEIFRAHPDYSLGDIQEFFLTMRRIYRGQLRSMCLLKKQ